jgi:hypothetical protein
LRTLLTNIVRFCASRADHPHDYLSWAAIELRYIAGDLQALADDIDRPQVDFGRVACRFFRYTGRMRWIRRQLLSQLPASMP